MVGIYFKLYKNENCTVEDMYTRPEICTSCGLRVYITNRINSLQWLYCPDKEKNTYSNISTQIYRHTNNSI